MNLHQSAYQPSPSRGNSAFADYRLRKMMPAITFIAAVTQPLAAGTSSADPMGVWTKPFGQDWEPIALRSTDVTDADRIRKTPYDATARALFELRRTSGLTWDQLAQLFSVSRRSVHFWASGRRMNATNEQHLFEILDIVQQADRGDTRVNRAALFTKSEGTTPFDLLAAKAFEEARVRLGRGPGRRRVKLGPLDAQAELERRPLPPGNLIDALNDPIHRDVGGGRAVWTVRNMRREPTE